MKHDGTIFNCSFRGPFYIHSETTREQPLQNNHRLGSRPKEFYKSKDTSKNICPSQATIACHHPKVNSVRFDDPYDNIHHMKYTHEDTPLIDTQEQDMEKNEFEKYTYYKETNDYFITV